MNFPTVTTLVQNVYRHSIWKNSEKLNEEHQGSKNERLLNEIIKHFIF